MSQNFLNKKICVIGLGYIGLPTASLLASRGFTVHGVDINQHAIDRINSGSAHIVEPDLDLIVKAAVNSGKLKAHTKPAPADIFIIAVPTPFKGAHKPDLAYVESATDAIIPFIQNGNIVVLESTSPVGTTEMIMERILSQRPDLKLATKAQPSGICVAYCPERVLPGSILRELIDNDRIVGGVSDYSTERTVGFYQTFVKGKILQTNARTAEMSKLSENAFRDVNIAFANELGRVCDHLKIDVWELIGLANHHPRVNILRPGPGVGGHCIAVDPWFIADSAPEQTVLIKTARKVNDHQPHLVFEKMRAHFAELQRENKALAILGLSYKQDIDDLRESPAVEIAKLAASEFKGTILVVEPNISCLPKELGGFSNLRLANYDSIFGESGLIAVLVNHKEFKTIYQKNTGNVSILDTVGISK